MKFKSLIKSIFCAFILISTSTLYAGSSTPKSLTVKVQTLVTVLSDGYAVGYPEATKIQSIKAGLNTDITLVVFSIEAFGGGNNYRQYLAAFLPLINEGREQNFALIDVIHIGGGGWRAIRKLSAESSPALKSNETKISIKALENTKEDALNFPSKEVIINLVLKNGRFYESSDASNRLLN